MITNWTTILQAKKLIFCLDWTVESWECGKLESWGCENKIWRNFYVFGLEYVRFDVWEKIIEVCECCDDCEEILIFFKIKYKFMFSPIDFGRIW